MSDLDLHGLNTPSVDFVILADRVEVLNGKLYMMGGGWDRLTVKDFAQPHQLSMAVGVQIPWNATNQPHRLTVRVESLDTNELMTAEVGFTPGRPPQLRDAQAQRVIFSITGSVVFPGEGTYIIKSLINDDAERQRKTFFHVLLAPKRLPQR